MCVVDCCGVQDEGLIAPRVRVGAMYIDQCDNPADIGRATAAKHGVPVCVEPNWLTQALCGSALRLLPPQQTHTPPCTFNLSV